ncbi:MAG: hypothetical protein ACXACH_02140 [Candidatus Hermodarchaeia archaeon]
MLANLSDRSRWILAAILISICAVIFAIGWTSPFWPDWYPILGSDFVKTSFFFISSGIFIGLLVLGLYILARTSHPPLNPGHSPDDT